MPTQKPGVTMIFDPQLLQDVEDFRFENRFPTRSAAITWLLRWALEQKPLPPALKERVGARD